MNIINSFPDGGGGGTEVTANPAGTATEDLEKLQIGTTIYGIPDDEGKADKVINATNGNIAALNASGNLTDSGKSTNKISTTFTGTTAEWTALSSTEKATYEVVNLTDDYDPAIIIDQIYNPLSTNAQSGIAIAEGINNEINNNTITYPRAAHTQTKTSPTYNKIISKKWNDATSFYGCDVWTDGNNIYISIEYEGTMVLDRNTNTWSVKDWNDSSINYLLYGEGIWSDGDNIYFSGGSNQYVLNKSTSTWNEKTWNGLTNFNGFEVWTDGNNIYYSSASNHYVLDKSTSTWNEKEWNGLTDIYGNHIWSDGEKIYYSYGSSAHYTLDKTTSTWTPKTWNNFSNFGGSNIWTDGVNIYISNGSDQYVLDKKTNTWNEKIWTKNQFFYSGGIWTDGINIYISWGNSHDQILV